MRKQQIKMKNVNIPSSKMNFQMHERILKSRLKFFPKVKFCQHCDCCEFSWNFGVTCPSESFSNLEWSYWISWSIMMCSRVLRSWETIHDSFKYALFIWSSFAWFIISWSRDPIVLRSLKLQKAQKMLESSFNKKTSQTCIHSRLNDVALQTWIFKNRYINSSHSKEDIQNGAAQI